MDEQNIRPASEDPLGDPADQESGVLPASQDPLGDPGTMDLQQAQYHPDFANAVQSHFSGMSPDQFQAHADQATQQMDQSQIQNTAQELLGSLQSRGFDIGQVTSMLGLGSSSPGEMGALDLSKLLGFAHQNEPGALGDTLGSSPGILQQFGGPAIQGILSNLARKLFGR